MDLGESTGLSAQKPARWYCRVKASGALGWGETAEKAVRPSGRQQYVLQHRQICWVSRKSFLMGQNHIVLRLIRFIFCCPWKIEWFVLDELKRNTMQAGGYRYPHAAGMPNLYCGLYHFPWWEKSLSMPGFHGLVFPIMEKRRRQRIIIRRFGWWDEDIWNKTFVLLEEMRCREIMFGQWAYRRLLLNELVKISRRDGLLKDCRQL